MHHRAHVAVLSCAGLVAAGATGGCQSSREGGRDAISAARVVSSASPATLAMMEQLKGLAGEWEMEDPKSPGTWTLASRIEVTSAGSVVREVMFPGSFHEMINTFHLDGDSILVTHYCAIGNQPRMRAIANDGHGHASNQLHFQFDSVTNYKGGDETYMGDLIITIEGPDRVSQSWRSLKGGAIEPESHAGFELRRRRS